MGILSALTRRRLFEGAGALSVVRSVPSPAEAPAAPPPAPVREEPVLDLLASVDPLGAQWQPISGGRFAGPRLTGDVLAGGTVHILPRNDGVTVVETACTLRTSEGDLLALSARALFDEAGRASSSVHAVPEFDVPTGAHDWLNRAVLVASLDASGLDEGRLSLRIHRIA